MKPIDPGCARQRSREETAMKIKATTYVICPTGTPIELYQNRRPETGQVFDIRHIETKKVVQRAKVTGVDQLQPKWFRVRAVITEQVK